MCRRRSQRSSAALTRIGRNEVVRWVRRDVHPTGHRRRAYCRVPAIRGPARRVRKIEGVPDHRRCVVVGAGLLGLSAAWALTRRGWDVVILETAGAPGHERSGSKGDARIFRLGYPEPHYVEMALLARERWRNLEAATGRKLLHVTGQVTLGDEATLHAIAGALGAAGAAVEEVPAGAAAKRFPGIAAAGMVLVESGSGVLAADECLRALQQAGGFEVEIGRRVTSLRQSSDSVTVGTADGAAIQADVVVDCAGPAALGLLGVATTTGAVPSIPQVAYFAARRSGDVALPVFIEWGDDMLYGLPVPGGGPHAGTYKVAHHTPGTALHAFDPADPAPLAADDPTLLALLTDAAARLLLDAAGGHGALRLRQLRRQPGRGPPVREVQRIEPDGDQEGQEQGEERHELIRQDLLEDRQCRELPPGQPGMSEPAGPAEEVGPQRQPEGRCRQEEEQPGEWAAAADDQGSDRGQGHAPADVVGWWPVAAQVPTEALVTLAAAPYAPGTSRPRAGLPKSAPARRACPIPPAARTTRTRRGTPAARR